MSGYDKAVAEARQLVTRSEDDQWRLAELTWQNIEPQGAANQTQWAQDVGLSQPYVGQIARVWERYGSAIERPKFADAVAGIKGMPIDRAERREMEATATVRRMAPERKAEVARELLADPAVQQMARQVLPRIAREEAVASGGIDTSRISAQGAPTVASHHLNVITLASIVTAYGRFVEDLAGLDPASIPARDRDAVLKAVAAIDTESANVRAYFDGELRDPEQALKEWSAQ